MREVDFDTFFTSSKLITLDSVYFQAGSRVQCAARCVNSNGDEGLELSSPIVSISMDEGECSSFSSLKCLVSDIEMVQHDSTFFSPATILAVFTLLWLKHERVFLGESLGNQNVWCLFVYGVVAGVCQPRVAGTVGAEPFSAKLRYTGTEDNDHPNLIKLTVTMPHIDGENSRLKSWFHMSLINRIF